jgi:hypothetical protein
LQGERDSLAIQRQLFTLISNSDFESIFIISIQTMKKLGLLVFALAVSIIGFASAKGFDL